MNDYLKFKYKTRIIYGMNGAVIYDLEQKRMFSVEILESKILKELEYGARIEDLYDVYTPGIVDEFCEKLIRAGVAVLYDTFVPRETCRAGTKVLSQKFIPYTLQRCFIELPFPCALDCDHCRSPKLFGCFSCSVAESVTSIDFSFYKNIFQQIFDFNCQEIYLYGGNPLAHWGETRELINYIRRVSSCKIYLLFAYQELDPSILTFIAKQSVIPVLNVNWPFVPETFNKKWIYNFNVAYADFPKFKSYCTNLNDLGVKYFSGIYSGEEKIKIDYIAEGFMQDMDTLLFEVMDIMHPCLCGQLAIKANKKIYVCKNMHEPIGDLTKADLTKIFSLNPVIMQSWSSATAAICPNCKYRKSCLNCRAFNENNPQNSEVSCIHSDQCTGKG